MENTPPEMTYTIALKELQQLVSEIENGEIMIDELSNKVKRAKDLIAVCHSKLTETEDDVKKLLDQFAAPAPDERDRS